MNVKSEWETSLSDCDSVENEEPLPEHFKKYLLNINLQVLNSWKKVEWRRLGVTENSSSPFRAICPKNLGTSDLEQPIKQAALGVASAWLECEIGHQKP